LITRVGSAGTLRYFVFAFWVFVTYYGLSNFGTISASPRLSGPMFGSMAQFAFPYACAVGTYLALSAEALGLYPYERLGSRSPFLRYFSELSRFVYATSASVLVLGVLVAASHLWLRIPPQVPLRHLFYPIGFIIAGAGVGLAIGRLLVRLTRPRRQSVVLTVAFAVGFNAFCIGVFQESIFGGDGRFSLIAGSRVTDPFEEVNQTLIWLHVVAAVLSGLVALWVTANLDLAGRQRRRVVFSGVVALTVVAAVIPLVLPMVPASLVSPRPVSDAECEAGEGMRICYWIDERPGALLLKDALVRGHAELLTVDLPAEVVQKGSAQGGTGAISVVNMPSDEAEANYYVAEFVVKEAGCSPERRSQANRLLEVTEYISTSLSTASHDFDPSRLDPLASC